MTIGDRKESASLDNLNSNQDFWFRNHSTSFTHNVDGPLVKIYSKSCSKFDKISSHNTEAQTRCNEDHALNGNAPAVHLSSSQKSDFIL
jgi:hypothetical protein